MKNIITLTLAFFSFLAFSQSDKELAEKSVTQQIIKSHIGFLASDEMRGRDTGSPELKIAAQYLKSRFVEYGVQQAPGMDTFFQPVPLKKITPAKSGQMQIADDTYELEKDFLMINGQDIQLEAGAVYAGYGSEKELKKAKIEGKIVYALCGDGKSQNPQQWFGQSIEKREMVKSMGGVALVELYNSPQIPWNFLVRYLSREQTLLAEKGEEKPLLHIWMNRSADDMTAIQKKNVTASVKIEGSKIENFDSQNVVGVVEGTDATLKNEYVVYSAHYDHVGQGVADDTGDDIYNGTRDNAVGTVTVLTAAQNIAANPTRRSALFVLFTGEEKGLLGSQYFVENSPIPVQNMVYCFNSDNGGYNDTSIATIIGLTRTSAEEMIVEACKAFGLGAIEDPAEEQGLFDRSDNVRFAAKGVPAPTFSMGFTAFDDEITKYYHQPGDEPNTVDYAYLEKFFKSYVYACRMIGNADEAPFWNEGDKYYEKGVELYERK